MKPTHTILLLFTAMTVALLYAACTSDLPVSSDVQIHPLIKNIHDSFHLQDNSGYPDSLAPVYPNPFNLVTGDTAINIYFTIKDTASVVLLMQNPLGDSVAVFKDATLGGGSYLGSWQPKNASGERLRAGLYFITLRITNAAENRSYINSELLSIEAN